MSIPSTGLGKDESPASGHDSPAAERMPPPLWVRPKEGMRLIGVKTTKFYELLNAGAIKSRRIGNMRLVEYASLMNIGDPPEGTAA